ncbi:MAG TPA: DUF819 family protein [Xanthomonadales bacterium]|nr:DUF819 family protein [Xanthomonadales bacterium]
MELPLINAENTFGLSAVIMVIVAIGLWAESKSWGQKIGGPLLLIAIAMALSNFGVIPYSAGVYDQIGGLLVPMAIPLLVMRADFRTIFSESGPMLVTFVVAVVATIIGAFAGVLVVDMGPLEAQLAGTVMASYIGGSLNYVATAEAVGLGDSSLYVAGLSADAVGAVFFLILLMLLPAIRFVRHSLPSKFIGQENTLAAPAPDENSVAEAPPFNLLPAATGLAVSLVVCAVSVALSALLHIPSMFILIVTAVALLVANFAKPLVGRVAFEFELGTLFMYIFFVAIGAGANLDHVLGAALPIMKFIVVMVLVHLVVVVLVGRFMKLDLAEVMIASNACILGPAPAAALAASKGWRPLVTPGIMVGLFGYAIATFIGIALTSVLAQG